MSILCFLWPAETTCKGSQAKTELCIQQTAPGWSWSAVSGVQAEPSCLQRLQSLRCSWSQQLPPAFHSFHTTLSIQNTGLLKYSRTWLPLCLGRGWCNHGLVRVIGYIFRLVSVLHLKHKAKTNFHCWKLLKTKYILSWEKPCPPLTFYLKLE